MQKIDKFLEFFLEHLDDERITIYKKLKYGCRYYHLNFHIDEDPNQNSSNNSFYQFRESMEIIFDNRNNCIEIVGGEESVPLIIEDKQLLEKWSNILEGIVSNNLEERVVGVFEKSLNDCFNKDLHRELQMKKIFKEDESL
jgi:hypothetical protein